MPTHSTDDGRGWRRRADVSLRVVEAVARRNRVDATSLPPLYETLDPDALDALFAPRPSVRSPHGAAISVQFTYAGRDVVVRSDGEIDVR